MVEVICPVNPDHNGDQVLVRHGHAYYVVSSADVPFSGPETLVFEADALGAISSYCRVAGGRGMSREEAIADLESVLAEGSG